MGKNKKSAMNIHSVSGRMFLLTTGAILVTVVFMCIAILPTVKSSLIAANNNNLLDLAVAYGSDLEGAMDTKIAKGEKIRVEEIADHVELARIKGCETSYAYVVSPADATVIYHPNEEMLGKVVDNQLVKDIKNQVMMNVAPQPEVISYVEDGVQCYGAFYYSMRDKFVLVVTVQESDFLGGVTQIVTRGLVASAIVFVLGLIIAYIISNRSTKPLKDIIKVVDQIATLDLTENKQLEKLCKNKDEAGQIARSVKSMRASLAAIVTEVKQQSTQLYGASDGLNDNVERTASNVGGVEMAVEEIAKGATNQASETQRANDGIVTMGNMIEDTNTEVTTLNDTANMMRRSNEIASQVLKELEDINQQAIRSIEIIYEQTNTTNSSAKKIREATSLIASIADETNLLSLNATIEAARAGEAGRGFAVVASEIQKLAEQSNESAMRIDEIIRQLVADSESAVDTMDEVQEIMKRQNENLLKTSEVFVEVQNGISASIDGVDEIANRTHELNNARNGIIDTVQSLTAIAEQNAASTQETSATVVEINEVLHSITENANHLKEIASVMEENMNKFKI